MEGNSIKYVSGSDAIIALENGYVLRGEYKGEEVLLQRLGANPFSCTNNTGEEIDLPLSEIFYGDKFYVAETMSFHKAMCQMFNGMVVRLLSCESYYCIYNNGLLKIEKIKDRKDDFKITCSQFTEGALNELDCHRFISTNYNVDLIDLYENDSKKKELL